MADAIDLKRQRINRQKPIRSHSLTIDTYSVDSLPAVTIYGRTDPDPAEVASDLMKAALQLGVRGRRLHLDGHHPIAVISIAADGTIHAIVDPTNFDNDVNRSWLTRAAHRVHRAVARALSGSQD